MSSLARYTISFCIGNATPYRFLYLSACNYKVLVPYEPPSWIGPALLPQVPSHRVTLARTNTPIHEWKLATTPAPFSLAIKRDDMTGSTLSGNKVRKLEFLLADAKKKQCMAVITCGGLQSNHCRATAIAARELGMDSYLFLRSPTNDPNSIKFDGNLLLDRMVGAKIFLVPLKASLTRDLQPRMDRLTRELKDRCHVTAYPIPIGGSNLVGFWGYVEAFGELLNQGVPDEYTDLVFACGSGGTASGLSVANQLTGNRLGVHAVAVCDDKNYFYGHVNETLKGLGLLNEYKAEDILDVIDGYKGRGYGLSTDEELDFVSSVSKTTGILLDPTYTGKAAFGMINEMRVRPERFRGNKVLFIHTGGVFGLFDGRQIFPKDRHGIKTWFDLDNIPEID